MNMEIYDGCGLLHPMFVKRGIIAAIEESAFAVVKEINGEPKCIKNIYDSKAFYECQEDLYEKVKISEISKLSKNINELYKKYYGKNVWLIYD